MQRTLRRLLSIAIAASACFASVASAAPPTAEQALGLSPIQKEVQYDIPEKAAAAKCKVVAETGDASGWVVRSDADQILRRFLDTNNDNKVDQWCYYRQGVEVYRDIDADYNGMADQYRWLGTGGTRWGVDTNEDGVVDSWKQISPEEVSAELVTAIRLREAARFNAILLTDGELTKLGLGTEKTKEISDKIAKAAKGFPQFATKQKVVNGKSEWLNFGGHQPGVLPAGTAGSKKDLQVYDNVAAVVETDGKTVQLPVGAIVRVGDTWKLIDLPTMTDDTAVAASGYFFQAPLPKVGEMGTDTDPPDSLAPEVQKLIAELEKIDKALTAARTPSAQAKLNAERADLMEQLAEKTVNPEDRANWQRQLADTVSAAVQAGGYPTGVERLTKLFDKLVADKAPANDLAYVKFRALTAAYTQSLQGEKSDFPKIQEQWLKDLETFVGDYPACEDAAEGMLQLAIAQEFAGKEDDATKWFDTIVTKFPKNELAKKAAGASYRLGSVGKPIRLKGKALNDRDFDLATLKGKVVVIHYWATWCEPCKADMQQLKTLNAKYAKGGDLAIVGISLDSEKTELTNFLKSKPFPWVHLYEPGGMESRLANELGILTLPTMLLIDKQGKVVSRNISIGEIETELAKMLK